MKQNCHVVYGTFLFKPESSRPNVRTLTLAEQDEQVKFQQRDFLALIIVACLAWATVILVLVLA